MRQNANHLNLGKGFKTPHQTVIYQQNKQIGMKVVKTMIHGETSKTRPYEIDYIKPIFKGESANKTQTIT